jgi:hypothetical protein
MICRGKKLEDLRLQEVFLGNFFYNLHWVTDYAPHLPPLPLPVGRQALGRGRG